MYKILVAEDSVETLFIIEQMLDGYDVTLTKSVKEAREALKHNSFALILLDISLPDGSGFEIIVELGEAVKTTPVLFLTGKTDFASKVSAFSLGADDFIQKPFDPKEIRLKIDSKLRRLNSEQEKQSVLKIGDINCHVQEQRIYHQVGHTQIDLTSLEFRIFHLLAKAPNKIFTRTEILERAWGSTINVTERAVDVHISNLRKKLHDTHVTIEAVIGSGYRVQVLGAIPKAN